MAAWERLRSVADRFLGRAPELVGWVPADLAVGRSVELRSPVILACPESAAARAIERVARWDAIDARGKERPFYDRARSALR